MTHPIDTVVQVGIKVPKAAFKQTWRARNPLVLLTANEIQAMVLADTTIVIYDGRTFKYDPTDTTSAHDGITVLVDGNVTGRRYKLLVGVRGFIHVQGGALAQWVVNHNLGYKPHVSVQTVGGLEVIAEVLHITSNQLVINFAAATAGTAYLV